MNLSDMRVFAKVVELGSFTAAAEQLGLTRSAASRMVSRLEKELGVNLLYRSSRHASSTEAGLLFYQHCITVDESVQQAVLAVSGMDRQPVGNLGVTLPSTLGAALMPGIVKRFRKKHPDLNLNLQFSEKPLDLIKYGLDVAVRLAQGLPDSSLSSRQIGETRRILAASPRYVAEHGAPSHVKDLENHSCLALSGPGRSRVVWRFAHPDGPEDVAVDCAISANTDLALVLAACMDEGILYIPELLISSEIKKKRLQIILAEYTDPEPYGVFVIHPHQAAPAKVQEFVNFLEKELSIVPLIDRWAPLSGKSPKLAPFCGCGSH